MTLLSEFVLAYECVTLFQGCNSALYNPFFNSNYTSVHKVHEKTCVCVCVMSVCVVCVIPSVCLSLSLSACECVHECLFEREREY